MRSILKTVASFIKYAFLVVLAFFAIFMAVGEFDFGTNKDNITYVLKERERVVLEFDAHATSGWSFDEHFTRYSNENIVVKDFGDGRVVIYKQHSIVIQAEFENAKVEPADQNTR